MARVEGMEPMNQKTQRKNAYNRARSKAMTALARNHPKEYEMLVEAELGRSLDPWGRTLTKRVKGGEKPWGERKE